MAKYSIVMTPTPCTVAIFYGCIISVRRTYSCTRALIYLLTYLHSLIGAYKSGNISETVEDQVTINGLKSYTGFRLPPKFMTLNDLSPRFKVIDSVNAAKMAKYSLVITPTPCRVLCLW